MVNRTSRDIERDVNQLLADILSGRQRLKTEQDFRDVCRLLMEAQADTESLIRERSGLPHKDRDEIRRLGKLALDNIRPICEALGLLS